ncbi:CPCC family cysteine-rich protein [Streptomyces sp. NPDC001795]|uniref:CPCC family cysteine-rich protein n=1 Tax=Streptomyces sp. NPDC001795 TaxID=3154525 RepID=UPI003332284E
MYRPVTLPERGALENSDVCSWEDDGQDEHDVDEVRGGPNHDLSLRQARQNFEAIGACNSTAPSSYAPRGLMNTRIAARPGERARSVRGPERPGPYRTSTAPDRAENSGESR